MPRSEASADNTDTRFDNSLYHAKAEFNNCFVLHFLNNLQMEYYSDEEDWKLVTL